MNKFNKLLVRIRKIIERFSIDIHNFSFELGMTNAVIGLTFEGRLCKKLYYYAYKRKHRIILQYLSQKFNDIIEDYKTEKKELKPNVSGQCIWVCWLQGEQNAPDLVKKCLESIRKNANGHPVILIEENNYEQYIELPDHIKCKYEEGMITKTHFSDILRVHLLQKYGGLWIDATIFCNNVIPESLFKKPIYSCKKNEHSDIYISDYRWTTFILGGSHPLFYILLKDMFEYYWLTENVVIDYLLFDYFIYLCFLNFKEIEEIINNIPYNNLKIDELVHIFNDEYSEQYKCLMEDKDNVFFKLSWKEQYQLETKDGKHTNYYYFMKGKNQHDDIGCN